MDLLDFLRDCGAGNCSYHNGFFLPTSVVERENLKRFYSQKKLHKAGRPGDQIRDRLFYELVDEI